MRKKFLEALEQFGAKCFAIVKANLSEDTFEILHTNNHSGLKLKSHLDFSNGLHGLWESFLISGEVYQKDFSDFAQYSNIEFVSDFMKKYDGNEHYEIEFDYRENENDKPIKLLIIAAQEYTNDNQWVYIFVTDVGNKMKEDYIRFDDLLRGLSENYSAIYYVDFDKDVVRPFRMNQAIESTFGDFFRSLPTYESAINGYIERVVAEKDRQMMYEVTKYEFLKKQLRNERAFSCEYHLERNNREYVFQMKVANMEGVGELHKAVMGFADVSNEKAGQEETFHFGRKILVVEDNDLNREMLSEILATQYEVIAACDGEEALDILGQEYGEIGLVITDLSMSKMDGYELLRQMKRNRLYCNIPVIVTTGESVSERGSKEKIEAECLELGASDFILKPYHTEIVMNRIKSIIHLRESTSMLSTLERDQLTGLLTKEFFFAKVSKFLKENPEVNCVMWTSDIVGLKVINEKYGLERGDAILKEIAHNFERYQGLLFGGRIEGDKFAALIRADCLNMYKDIMKDHDMGIDFSVPGVVIKHGFYHIKPNSALPPQGMYDRALLALHTIKDTYGVYYAEYDDEVRKDLLTQRMIAENAETALTEHQFIVYFQPKFDLHLGRTSGAEALIRWIHPELGFMNPGIFISQFEQNGFIKELDLYVWEEVCKMLSEWKEAGRKLIPISVNASRRDFDDRNFAKKVIGIANRYGIAPNYFHIEVTESAYSDNPERIKESIKEFHDNGFIVELDDFGAGYSSMTALSELDLDIMKLDMSIIQNDDPKSDKNILDFSMQLAKMMRLQTVAEGVETEAQVERISSLGGDYIQGYYYSKPLPRQQFEEYLENEKQTISKYLTYEKIVNEAKMLANDVDVSSIRENLAVEFEIIGVGEGVFYMHFSSKRIKVEPYQYYDHDFRVRAAADTIISMLNGELSLERAMAEGKAFVSGNVYKLDLLKRYIGLF